MSIRAFSRPHPDAVRDIASFPLGFDPSELHVDPKIMNKGVRAEFFFERLECEPLKNEDGSITEREPIEDERVRIRVAGDVLTEFVGPVTDEIKKRFPEEYSRWKDDAEGLAVGR
jgi:hypothetical protein